jgi:hypothetical protein
MKERPSIHPFTITCLKFPQFHVTGTRQVVEMTVGILWHEVARAEIAKMGLAFEADHVIATHSLLSRRIASRTGRREFLQIRQAGSFFRVEFLLPPRATPSQLTMP